MALVAIAGGVRLVEQKRAATSLVIMTEPPGVNISIGDRRCTTPGCSFELPPGLYRVNARKPGYATSEQDIRVRNNEPGSLRLVLTPIDASVRITSNFRTGAVYLDDAMAGQMTDGEFKAEHLRPGRRRFRIAGPDGEASFVFQVAPAAIPKLAAPITTKNTTALAAASMGSAVELACAGCQGAALVDGKPVDGRAVPSGDHEATAQTAGLESARIHFRTGDLPTLAIHVISEMAKEGTLVIESNVDGASIVLNEKALNRKTESGRVMIPLEARDYTIRLQKAGYRVIPDHVNASVSKGHATAVTFRLVPEPSVLMLVSRQQGATVLIDGAKAGVVGSTPYSAEISAGRHTVALAREGFRTASASVLFQAGETVRLGESVLRLEPAPKAAMPFPQPQQTRSVPIPPAPPALSHPGAEEIEAADWAAARSSRDRNAIQAFLQTYPNSARRDDAAQLIAQLDWNALDKKDRAALERFAAQHKGAALAQQASAGIARMEEEAKASAAKKIEEQAAADRTEIEKVLSLYAAAFDRKDLRLLKSVWPNLPEAALAQAFRTAGEIRSRLNALAPPELNGNAASIRCTRIRNRARPSAARSRWKNCARCICAEKPGGG